MPLFSKLSVGSIRISFIIVVLTVLDKSCLSFCTDAVTSTQNVNSGYQWSNNLPHRVAEMKDLFATIQHERLKDLANPLIDQTSASRHFNTLFPYLGPGYVTIPIFHNQQQKDVYQYGTLQSNIKPIPTKKVFLSLGWGPGGQKIPKDEYLIGKIDGKGLQELDAPSQQMDQPNVDTERDYNLLNPFVQGKIASGEKARSEPLVASDNRNYQTDDYTYQDDESVTVYDSGSATNGPVLKAPYSKPTTFGSEKNRPLNVHSLRKLQVPELLYRAYTMEKKLKELLQRPIRKPPVTVYPPTYGIGAHKVPHTFPFPNTHVFADTSQEGADSSGSKQRVNRHTDRERLLQVIRSLENKYLLQLLRTESEAQRVAEDGGEGRLRETESSAQQAMTKALPLTDITATLTSGPSSKIGLQATSRDSSLAALPQSSPSVSKFGRNSLGADASPAGVGRQSVLAAPPGSSSHLSAANKGFHSIFTSGSWGPMGEK